MSLAASAKRKRPGAAAPLTGEEQQILDLILSKEGSGISGKEINWVTKIPTQAVNKIMKTLLQRALVKEMKGIQNGGRKLFMGVEFTPSDQVSGGFWYQEGKIDTELVDSLKKYCHSLIKKNKVATLAGLHKAVKDNGITTVETPKEQMAELLTMMVLDNEIVEVKSTGLGIFSRVPIGETCYKLPSSAAVGAAKTPPTGAFASIPCGMCPRISLCRPDGVVSPTTCEQFNKWLDIKDLKF